MKNSKKDFSLDLNLGVKSLRQMRKNHDHWNQSAKKHGQEYAASWKDIHMIRLEIRNLLEFIEDGDFILDAGCSNGYTTFEILKQRNVQIHGVDYCQTAIEHANIRKDQENLGHKVTFSRGNLLNLKFDDHTFDKVMTVRVLINLPSFALQKKAITEIHRVLKPNGIYLMSEGFSGSLRKLNALRKLASMPPLQMPEVNLYLNETRTERFLKKYFEIQKICRFSSIYYAGTRFMQFMVRDLAGKDSYNNDFNNFYKDFCETPFSGDFGLEKLYVLKMKE